MDWLDELRARLTAGAGAGLEGFAGVGARLERAGDELLLMEPDSALATEEKLEALVAMLAQRNFLRSAVRVGEGGLVAALAAAARASEMGVEVSLEAADVREALLGPRPLAALVSCQRNAHLALVLVAERGTAFRAQAIGRVVEQGFAVRVNGEDVVRCSVEELGGVAEDGIDFIR